MKKEIEIMPIRIPNDLPAVKTLNDENIFVMTETRAITQDIRPLKILLLNLMPKKIETETQLSRLLGNSPLQVELELIHTKSHLSKNTPQEHMLAFYKTFDDVKHRTFDGMIITGAPVELMPFEDVEYWHELCEIMEWTKTHVHSTFHICWGAQAGLYYHLKKKKKVLPGKMFGVFPHTVDYKNSILFRGFDDVFMLPHSRHTTIDDEPAATVREGNIIRKGFSAEVDELRDIFQDGKNFITKIEATERENTGIKTLKVRYNKVFGYYIEVPNSFKGDVPDTYIRKQTLTGAERFITKELKDL